MEGERWCVCLLQDMPNDFIFCENSSLWCLVMVDYVDRRAIEECLKRGMTPAQVAASIGCSVSTVYRVRAAKGARKGDRAGHEAVTVRLSTRELVALDGLVRAGLAPTKPALLRKLARTATQFYAPNVEEEAFLVNAASQLSRLGGNFNQIAQALSASVKKVGTAYPTRKQVKAMHEAEDELDRIELVVRAMLENMQIKSATLAAQLKRAGRTDD
jgi:transposase-like protein